MKLSLPVVLFLIFLVLKLTKHITWSWWWVTCPLRGAFSAWIVFGFIYIAWASISNSPTARRHRVALHMKGILKK